MWETLMRTKVLKHIDIFHGLNILSSAFIFTRPASYWVAHSFGYKARERGLTGKFQWRQKNNYTMKKVYGHLLLGDK